MTPLATPTRRSVASRAVVWTLIAAYPFVADGRWLTSCIIALILAVAALGLHLITGLTGMLSLGHAFFFGIGAVVAAWLGGKSSTGFSTADLWGLGLPVWIWLPLAGVVAGIAGLIVAPSAARLDGLPLGIVTLGLVFLGTHLFATIELLSGGVNGRPVPSVEAFRHNIDDAFAAGPLTFDSDRQWYFLALAVVVVAYRCVGNLERSRFGSACTAIRDRNLTASVLGVPVQRVKVSVFVVGCALAGIAGALYGSFLGRIAGPEQFDLFLSLQFVVIIVIGGSGSRIGAVVGSIFVALLPVAIGQFSPSLPFLSVAGSPGLVTADLFAVLLYGATLIVALRYEPRGLSGLANRMTTRARAWPLLPDAV